MVGLKAFSFSRRPSPPSPDRLELTSLGCAKSGTALYSLSYGYSQGGGNNGQIQCVTDNVDTGRGVKYTYDPLARLATAVTTGSASYPQWGLSWAYDRYGNRTAQTVTAGTGPSNSVTIDANTNRITGAPYAYEANGNMTNDGLNALSYDAENRLVTSSGSTYSYDGKSLRVQKVASGTTTVYIFSGSKVIAEYVNGAAPASPSREYIYSAAQLVATIEGGATKYHHADHLSVRVTTDTGGNVLGQQGHYPYGESWYASSTTTKCQFTSRFMWQAQKGFSLLELLIVVAIILIIASVSIPNLLRTRMTANDVAAVASLRAINTACFLYLSAYGGYPPTLASLGSPSGGSLTSATAADLIDSVLASGSKTGYTFTYTAGAAVGGQISTYTVVADPIRRGATGQRGFFTDQAGVIRANPTGTADSNSTPIS